MEFDGGAVLASGTAMVSFPFGQVVHAEALVKANVGAGKAIGVG